MLEYKGYVGIVNTDDGSVTGRVVGIRDVVTFEGQTYAEVDRAFRDSIDDSLAFCAERGEEPDRTFSEKISLRVPPDLHRKAATRAEADGVSLNRWIAKRIESAA